MDHKEPLTNLNDFFNVLHLIWFSFLFLKREEDILVFFGSNYASTFFFPHLDIIERGILLVFYCLFTMCD